MKMTMRRALAILWLLAWAPVLQAAGGGDCPRVPAVPWQSVVPGVWVWSPPDGGDVSAANGGHVGATSVLIAGRQALVVDPGPSQRHGEWLRRSLACRFGARVRWIVNTHAHADSVLANSAFAEDVAAGRAEILSNAPTREAMQRRCPDCLASLTRRLGASVMVGTRIVWPTRTLVEGEVLRLGPWRLQVLRTEQGHTEGDLVLWEAGQRLLWAGGLVYAQRVPEMAQGRLDGWLAALQRLQALRPRHLIATTWSSADADGRLAPLEDTRAYLSALREQTLAAMDRGALPLDREAVPLPAFAGWAGYGERHGLNVQRAWRELEPVWMDRAAPPLERKAE